MRRRAVAAIATMLLALAAPAAVAAVPLHLQDRAFLLYALELDLAQVEFGELAAEKGADAGVRDLARRVVDYHAGSRARLGQVAARNELAPPTELNPVAARTRAALQRLSGPAFDRAFLASQVIADYSAHFGARREMLHGFNPELRREAAIQAEDMRANRRAAERLARELPALPATGLNPEDGNFLAYAMHVDLAQAEFARITAERAEDERVRAFAQRMIDYHEQSYDRLARLAEARGVAPLRELSSVSLRTQDGMRRLSGLPLDWTYLNAHAFTSYGAHYRYEREAIHGQDEELRSLAAMIAREAREQHHQALDIMGDWTWGAS